VFNGEKKHCCHVCGSFGGAYINRTEAQIKMVYEVFFSQYLVSIGDLCGCTMLRFFVAITGSLQPR
jgi:hypothetical protein